MAQLVEHILGKDEVPSSNLGSSSKTRNHPFGWFFVLESLLAIRIRFSRSARKPVRIRHPKIAKLAWQAKGARIFASANTWGFLFLATHSGGFLFWSRSSRYSLQRIPGFSHICNPNGLLFLFLGAATRYSLQRIPGFPLKTLPDPINS